MRAAERYLKPMLLLILASTILIIPNSQSAQTSAEAPLSIDLLHEYSPVLQFDSGENFYPMKVDPYVANSALMRGQGANATLMDPHPTPSSLACYTGPGYYLQSNLGGYEGIRSWYASQRTSLGYTIYGRVIVDGATGDTAVQYWFFYAYNDAVRNYHEGDWEGITVVLNPGGRPLLAAYTQHRAGQRAAWMDVEVVDGTHPVDYVARGSHANYFRPYRCGIDPWGDALGAGGLRLGPTRYTVVALGDPSNHTADEGWLSYVGRFGREKPLDVPYGCPGPYGPDAGPTNLARWSNPVTWAKGLASVNGYLFRAYWLLTYPVPLPLAMSCMSASGNPYVRGGVSELSKFLPSNFP
jgi:hypothetical protein